MIPPDACVVRGLFAIMQSSNDGVFRGWFGGAVFHYQTAAVDGDQLQSTYFWKGKRVFLTQSF